jgi:hypothetical protein
MGGRRVWGAIAAAVIVLAGACTPDGDPAATGGSSPTPTQLPVPADGRLTRILGDGTWHPLSRPGFGPDASVHAPVLLAVSPTQSLLGVQSSFPSVFEMQANGRVDPLMNPGGFSSGRPVAATATEQHLVLAYPGTGLVVADRETGDLARAGAPLPSLAKGRWASAFLEVGGSPVLQLGDDWFAVSGLDSGQPAATRRAAVVPGAIAAAQNGDAAVVLTSSQIVPVSAAGRPGHGAPWEMPERFAGASVTSATSDGSGGLIATVSTVAGRASSGAVIHVARDGATALLAAGRKRDRGSEDCQDAQTQAMASHLGQPLSIVTWLDRLVIADAECNSVLQLPLPEV